MWKSFTAKQRGSSISSLIHCVVCVKFPLKANARDCLGNFLCLYQLNTTSSCAEVAATGSPVPEDECTHRQQHPLKSFLVTWGHFQPFSGFVIFLVYEVN